MSVLRDVLDLVAEIVLAWPVLALLWFCAMVVSAQALAHLGVPPDWAFALGTVTPTVATFLFMIVAAPWIGRWQS